MAVQASWTGQPRVRGSTESMRMFLLVCSIIGLQFAWGTEMTYCNPYLLSLGLPKSKLSFVWIAGPLSGLVMQPIIGILSDKSTSKYGRRRPYMLCGTCAVVVCYTILGWSKDIAGWFAEDQERKRQYAILLAVADIYVLDFVINIAQSTCRALVVDTLPISKQQLGAAWIARMVGTGHLLVYAIGALDLNSILGNFLGDTQFKKVCVIAAIAMAVSQGLSCWAVQERVLISDHNENGWKQSIRSVLSQIYTTLRHVPERIQAICWVQFWSWIGWFPFLFYGSTWVGEIYLRYEKTDADSSRDALDMVGQQGSRALIVYSIIGTISSIVLPWLIQNPEDEGRHTYTARPPRSLKPVLKAVSLRKPSLLTAWALANLLFAAAMIWAPLVESVAFATVLVAICGVSTAIGGFAPVTFLGVEVNRMSNSIPVSHSRHASYRKSLESVELNINHNHTNHTDSNNSTANNKIDDDEDDLPNVLRLRADSNASTVSSTGELSGIYLGILNIYTTLPQFVGTGISWVVFSILEPGKSPELTGDGKAVDTNPRAVSAIGVCLFIGALSAVGAAWATRRLRRSFVT